jgi:hypothetical protein
MPHANGHTLHVQVGAGHPQEREADEVPGLLQAVDGVPERQPRESGFQGEALPFLARIVQQPMHDASRPDRRGGRIVGTELFAISAFRNTRVPNSAINRGATVLLPLPFGPAMIVA